MRRPEHRVPGSPPSRGRPPTSSFPRRRESMRRPEHRTLGPRLREDDHFPRHSRASGNPCADRSTVPCGSPPSRGRPSTSSFPRRQESMCRPEHRALGPRLREDDHLPRHSRAGGNPCADRSTVPWVPACTGTTRRWGGKSRVARSRQALLGKQPGHRGKRKALVQPPALFIEELSHSMTPYHSPRLIRVTFANNSRFS